MTPKEFIKSWFADIDANKFDALKKKMNSNHQFNNPMTPTTVGSDQHLGMIQQMTDAWEGGHTLDVVISEGEWVTARGRWSGKHTGEFNGVPATGKHIEFSFLDMMHVVNDQVVEEYFELNPMSIMQQIAPAGAA